jgi:hypothetical protein
VEEIRSLPRRISSALLVIPTASELAALHTKPSQVISIQDPAVRPISKTYSAILIMKTVDSCTIRWVFGFSHLVVVYFHAVEQKYNSAAASAASMAWLS